MRNRCPIDLFSNWSGKWRMEETSWRWHRRLGCAISSRGAISMDSVSICTPVKLKKVNSSVKSTLVHRQRALSCGAGTASSRSTGSTSPMKITSRWFFHFRLCILPFPFMCFVVWDAISSPTDADGNSFKILDDWMVTDWFVINQSVINSTLWMI